MVHTPGRPVRAATVVGEMLEHVRPALEAAGDDDLVAEGLRRVLTEGTGADRQRAAFRRTSRLTDVVLNAAEATVATGAPRLPALPGESRVAVPAEAL